MKKALSILLSVILILQFIPVFGAAVLTSPFASLAGVPVTSSIPLNFSESVNIEETDITVTAGDKNITDFTLEGSGTQYVLKFLENMYYGVKYEIETPYGSITYFTSYGADVASIPVNTPAGSGRIAEFGKSMSNLTLEINFIDSYGLPDNKNINLSGGGSLVSSVGITNFNNAIQITAFRYENGSKIGPALLLNDVTYTDKVYVTYKNDTVYPYVVSEDGSVRYGTKWSYADKSIAGSSFDKMTVDSVVFGVSAGDSVSDIVVEEEVEYSVTSDFDKLPGVPVDALIPITLSESALITSDDVTITGADEEVDSFELSGSGTQYYLSFEKDYNTEYTVSFSNGDAISFTTCYDTKVASIPVNTPAGSGRTAEFGVELDAMTLKIGFTDAYGLPASKNIYLYNNGTAVSSIGITNKNNAIQINGYRFDNGVQYGPTDLISGIEFADTVYITYHNDRVYPFALSPDGTAVYGTLWNYSDKSIAGTTFDKMAIDSVVFSVDVGGNSVEGDNPEGGDPEGGDPEGGDPEGGNPEGGNPDDDKPEPDLTSSLNGCVYVPVEAGIPLTFKELIVLTENDFKVTKNGALVSDITVETTDDINYTLLVNGGMDICSDYTIEVVSDEKFTDDIISFSTAYATNKESLVVKYDGNQMPISRPLSQFTLFTQVTEHSYSVNSNKYCTIYDTRENTDTSLKSEKFIRFYMYRASTDKDGYGVNVSIKNGAQDSVHNLALVPSNTIPVSDTSPVFTYKNGIIYAYSINGKNEVKYYGTVDISDFVSDFKATTFGGNGTNFLTAHLGYGNEFKAKLIKSGAQKDDEIKIEFSDDISEFPTAVTVSNTLAAAEADVTVQKNVAILKLKENITYNSVFTVDLSEFKDRLGEGSHLLTFNSESAPAFYKADNLHITIDGKKADKLSQGELGINVDVEKLCPSDYDNVIVVVALYKSQGDKTYLCSIKNVAQADFEAENKKTVSSETTVTVPKSENGERYFAKLFLYPKNAGLFSLVPSITIR